MTAAAQQPAFVVQTTAAPQTFVQNQPMYAQTQPMYAQTQPVVAAANVVPVVQAAGVPIGGGGIPTAAVVTATPYVPNKF